MLVAVSSAIASEEPKRNVMIQAIAVTQGEIIEALANVEIGVDWS